MISLVFDVGEELRVNEGVFLLVSVHAHHGANCAASNDDQQDGDPDKSLYRNQVRVLLAACNVSRGPSLVSLVVIWLCIRYNTCSDS